MIPSWPRPLLMFALLASSSIGLSADQSHDLASLERSFWLHASLSAKAHKGYWGPSFPPSPIPSEHDVRNAAKLLTDTYAANRLYLVYHKEIPLEEAELVFRWWRQHCPEKVTLVPTLVLRMYDQQQTPVFTSDDLRRLIEFLKRSVNAEQLAVYDVYPNRDQGESLKLLAEQYTKGLIRVGILQANSGNPAHDGSRDSFYETLRRGEAYTGYYSVPFQEIVAIYEGLRDGKRPMATSN